ncbi:MAG: type II secretion system protein [Deltaproteobacteria bacterium]|nr:type II secretion system protein [Deltaproteobacteria bacterium]
MRRLRDKKGFTLVEIAIVLVIIGLLLGAILKGQGMIKNAKIKNVMRSADEIRAAVYTYQDRYKMLPGDDNNPVGHTGVGGLVPGNGSGQITGSEALHVFNHLAAAQIISGSHTLTTYPTHAFGDSYYLSWATAQGKTTHWVVYTNIPGDAGRSIDFTIDDGRYNTGAVRASANYPANSTVTLYNEF